MPTDMTAVDERLLPVLDALERLVDGLSATQAAHRAGFSDAAHLARTWRRMNGQSPTELGSLPSFVTICDDAAGRLRGPYRGDGAV